MSRLVFILLLSISGGPLRAANVNAEFRARVQREVASQGGDAKADAALRGVSPKHGKGWAVVDTSRFFPKKLMNRFHESLGALSRANAQTNRALDATGGEGEAIKTLTPEQMAPLQEYVGWLKASLNRVLAPGEQVSVAEMEVHVQSGAQQNRDFGPWHVDEDYMSAVVTLFGAGTQYYATGPKLNSETFATYRNKAESRGDARETPRGSTIVWSGAERAVAFDGVTPTIHRIPPTQDRIFLVVRFKRQ